MIPRGTFVCEFIGEVVNEQEAKERHSRFQIISKKNYIFLIVLYL